MKKFNIILSLVLSPIFLFAQQIPEHKAGQIIVKLFAKNQIEPFLEKLNSNSRALSTIELNKTLVKSSNLHLIEFDPIQINEYTLLENIQKRSEVDFAQFNHKIDLRSTTPDDAFFDNQWHMETIEADKAWDISTGGLTANGDTIVVAVLDGGYEMTHPDLVPNYWRNYGEIEGDNMDNDGNGFVDDVWGWNPQLQSDNHPNINHGNSVAGIIGAKGNNGIGVTGVNWDVKMMLFSGVNFEDEVVESYGYVRDMRQKYNETDGEDGAFVVATNYSLGIDSGNCIDSFPLWNMMFDSLGYVGIISAGATANANVNVDLVGDVPSACQSDFLITVTNTNEEDKKIISAAYGPINVDLSAPGQLSYSTKINNNYGNFQGTSGATPHVAGAIALLYSIPCEDIANAALEQPEQTALLMKQFIMDGVDPLDDLGGITVTGGRLNVFNSVRELQGHFSAPKGKLAIPNIYPNPAKDEIFVVYQTPDFTDYDVKIYNAMGQLIDSGIIPELCAPKTIRVPVSNLANGIYFITLENRNDIISGRFVVNSQKE